MIQVVARCVSDVVREACHQQAAVECRRLGHVDGVTVQLRATMFNGCEEFVPRGVNDHAKNTAPLVLKADGDAVGGVAVSKISGAVEWVDDPEIG